MRGGWGEACQWLVCLSDWKWTNTIVGAGLCVFVLESSHPYYLAVHAYVCPSRPLLRLFTLDFPSCPLLRLFTLDFPSRPLLRLFTLDFPSRPLLRLFTLDFPSYYPVMTHCKNRVLREEMYRCGLGGVGQLLIGVHVRIVTQCLAAWVSCMGHRAPPTCP